MNSAALALDARWMVGDLRGMGHYARTLVAPVRDRLVALLPRGVHTSDYRTTSAGHPFFPWWEQWVLPRLCLEAGASELLCPYNTAPVRLPAAVRLTLVVHDLIYLEPWSRLPPSISAYQTAGRLYRRLVVPAAIRRADRVLAVSEYTADQIAERFGLPRRHIQVIPNSLEDGWYVPAPLPASSRDDFVLAVAGEAPSKNLAALIGVFGSLNRRLAHLPRLKVAGVRPAHHPHFRALAASAGIGHLFELEGFLAEADLRALYRRAQLFVMPSLYEGFGIPVLEAMASGTAVACSDATSLPEVLAGSGWLFDPRSRTSMEAVLAQALEDAGGREDAALRGLAGAERYRRGRIEPQIRRFWEHT